jgi:hypothetical protein
MVRPIFAGIAFPLIGALLTGESSVLIKGLDLGDTQGDKRVFDAVREMGGAVEKFQDPTRLCYDIIPFVYTAQARTLAGVVYPYLEMDYYVPSLPYPCAMQMGSSSTVFGPHLFFP